jgi:anti-sigma-K factor RskA
MAAADDQLEEMAVAYALGALEPDELAWAEAALLSDPAFRKAVDEARAVTDLLSLAAPVLTPPASVRSSLMHSLNRTPAAPPRRPVAPPPPPARPWWQGWWRPAMAAVAACLVLALGFTTMTARQELLAEREQAQVVAPKATQSAQAVAALSSPYSTSVPLRPLSTGSPPDEPMIAAAQAGSDGKVVLDPLHSQIVLVVRQLPQLPPSRAYQVWLAPAGESRLTPYARLQVDLDGFGYLTLPMPPGMDRAYQVLVTVEPEEGSAEPTGQPVLSATF